MSTDTLLMIVPSHAASAAPLLDDLTAKMTAAYRQSQTGVRWRGSHHCICGAWSDCCDHWVGDVLTNSLCVHYLAFHRADVPLVEIEKVRALTFGEAVPTREELVEPRAPR